jgi:hypothetical protein
MRLLLSILIPALAVALLVLLWLILAQWDARQRWR